jgi:hypothetical protein
MNTKFNYKLQITNFTVMKKIFLAVLTVLAIVSCSTTDNEPLNEVPRGKALLNVAISTPSTTRAKGTAVATDEISNFTVFVTDQTDEIKWKAYSAAGENFEGKHALEVSTQAKNVYIVANAGDLRSTINTMAQLTSKVIDLNAESTLLGLQKDARWATGCTSAPIEFSQIDGENSFEAGAKVVLTFVASRITLKINNKMKGYDATQTGTSLKLEKVLVLNARGQSLLYAPENSSSLIPTYTPGKMYYEGMENDDFDYFPDEDDYTYNSSAATLLSDVITANDFATTYSYYVFENNAVTAEAFPTIITIAGTFKGQPIYFPVHLAPYEELGVNTVSGITRGNSYDITITLSGDPSDDGSEYPGGTGGTDDPTSPIVSADVKITMELTPWAGITLGKEFK